MDDPGEAAIIGAIRLDLQRGKKVKSSRPPGSIHYQGPEQVSEAALKGEAKSLRVEYVSKTQSKLALSPTNNTGWVRRRRHRAGQRQSSNRKTKSLLSVSSSNIVPAVKIPLDFYNSQGRLTQATANLQALHIVPRDESPPPPTVVKSRSSSLVSTPQNEPGVKSEISWDATPVRSQDAGLILHTPRSASMAAPASGLQQATPQSTPMPSVASVPSVPPSRQQTTAPPGSTDQDGLTAEEIIVMVAGYRGHNRGLAGQSQRSLMSLLKHYEVCYSFCAISETLLTITRTKIVARPRPQKVQIMEMNASGSSEREAKNPWQEEEREVIVLDD